MLDYGRAPRWHKGVLGRAKDIMQENNEEGYVKELVYLDTPIIYTPEELMGV